MFTCEPEGRLGLGYFKSSLQQEADYPIAIRWLSDACS